MPSVDNRVVEMRFDNKDFESGVSTSLGTIEKLKKSLNMKEASKGFDELDRAANKVNFSPLMDAAEAVTNKFSAFGVIGDQVLRRIGDQVANLEARMVGLVKSMSIDQVTAGWGKYEEKTSSVQTIMNATGLSIEQVNEQLDRLMWFSDETSFGFTDMTKALQTMTAAGGDLENLIPMLMGMGNAVAYAGKGSAEFSRVVYNLNQAYGMGYLGTMDWRSVELAGASSKQLKETLLRWAKDLGKMGNANYGLEDFSKALTDKIFDKEVMERAFGEFAEVTLEAEKLVQQGVFDTASEAYDYLSQSYHGVSMSAATAAQEAKTFVEAIEATKDAVSSGWMTTFEHLFGNYIEAKQLWTWLANELWDVFASGAEARNNMLKEWHDGILDRDAIQAAMFQVKTLEELDELRHSVLSGNFRISGYEMAIEAITNLWDGLKDILYAVKAAWRTVFPQTTAEQLVAFTAKIRDATASFREMFTYVEEKREKFVDPLLKALGIVDEEVEGTAESIEENAGMAAESLDELAYAVIRGEYGNGQTRFDALGAGWKLVQNRVNELLGVSYRYTLTAEEEAETMQMLGGETESVAEATEELTEEMGESTPAIKAVQGVIRGMAGAVSILKQTASALWTKVAKPALKGILKLLTPVFNKISEIGNKIADIAKEWEENGKIEEFLDKVVNVFNRIAAPFKTFAAKVKEIIDRVKRSQAFKDFTEKLGQLGDVLKDIGGQVGEKVLSLFDSLNKSTSGSTWVDTIVDVLGQGLTFLNTLLDEIIPKLEKVNLDNLDDFFNGLGTTWGNVTSFFKNPTSFISGITSGSFFNSFFGSVEGTFDSFVDSLTGGGEEAAEAMVTTGEAAQEASGGIHSFVDVLDELISGVDFAGFTSSLSSGGGNVTEFFSGLGSSLADISKNVKISDIVAILGAVSAIGVAASFKKLASGASTMFGTINGFVKNLSRRKAIPLLVQVGIAIIALAGAIYVLSTIDAKQLQYLMGVMLKLGIGMVVAFGMIAGISKLFGGKDGKNLTAAGFALVEMAAAVLILAFALKVLEDVDLEGVRPKLITLGIILVGLGVISRIMNKTGKGAAGTGFGMIALVGSIWLLGKVLMDIKDMDFKGVQKNLKTLLGVMTVLGIIARIMNKGAKVKGSGTAKGSSAFGNAMGMLVMVGVIYTLAKVLEKLKDIDISGVEGKVLGLVGVMTVFAFLIRIMSKSTGSTFTKSKGNLEKTKQGVVNAGWQMIEMAAAVYIIAMAFERLAGIDAARLQRGMDAFKWIMGFLLGGEFITTIPSIISSITGKGKDGGQKGVFAAVIALAVGAYVAALAIERLGNLDPEVLKQGGMAFGQIAAVLSGGVTVMLAAASGIKGAGAAAIGLMVLLIGAFAAAVWFMKDIPADQILVMAESMALVFAAMSFVLNGIADMSKADKSAWAKSLLPIIVIMGAVFGAIVGIALLTKDVPAEELFVKMVAMSAVLVALAAATWIISKAKFGDMKDVGRALAAITGLSILLVILTTGLAYLLKLPAFAEFSRHSHHTLILTLLELAGIMAALGLVAMELAVAARVINKLNVSGKDLFKAGVVLAALALILEGMIAGLVAIATMPGFQTVINNVDDIIKLIGALTLVLGALTLLTGGAALVGNLGGWGTLIGELDILGLVAILEGMIAGLVAIATMPGFNTFIAFSPMIMRVVDSLVDVLGKITVLTGAAAVIGFAGGAAFTGELAIGAFVVIISAIMALMTDIADIVSDGGNAERIAQIEADMDLVVSFFEHIGEAIGSLISGIGVGLTSGLPDMGANLAAFSENVQPFLDMVSGITTEMVEGTGRLFEIMSMMFGTGLEGSFTNMISSWFGALTVGGDDAGGDWQQYSDDMVTVFTGLADIYKVLSEVEMDPALIENAKIALESLFSIELPTNENGVFDKLKSWFVGKEQTPEELLGPDSNLQKLFTAFSGFANSQAVRDMDPEKVIQAVDALNKITAIDLSKVLEVVEGNDTGEYQKFGYKMAAFADGLSDFFDAFSVLLKSNSIQTANVDKIDLVVDAVKKVAALDLSKMLEVVEGDGEEEYSSFGTKMASFGEGLGAFFESIKGVFFSSTKLDNVKMAVEKLAEMNELLPKGDGFWQDIVGESGDMGDWGKQLRSFAQGLVGFYQIINSEGVDWTDTTAIDGAIKIGEGLATLNQQIVGTGGLFQDIFGEQQLAGYVETLEDGTKIYKSGWADQLYGLADGLARFYSRLTRPEDNIDWNQATNDEGTGVLDGALKIANFLAELNNALPSQGGLMQLALGEKNLEDFGHQLAMLGHEMSMFATYVDDIDDDDIMHAEKVKAMMDPFIDAFKAINDDETFIDILNNLTGTDFQDMGTMLKDMGEGFSEFNEATKDIQNWDNLETATANLTALADAVKNWASLFTGTGGTGTYMGELQTVLDQLGEVSLEGFSDRWRLGNLLTDLQDPASNFVSALHSSLNSPLYNKMRAAGKNAGEGLVYGLEAKLTLVKEAAKALGQATMDGYALGVSENEYLAIDAVTTAVNNAIQAGADAQSSASPSKEYAKLGMYGMMGYANGLLGMSSTAEDAARSVVMNSLGTVRDTISMLAAAIESDIEMDPTIRPVLDLSQLRAGASQANSLLTRTLSTVPDYARAARVGTEVNGMKATAARVKADQTGNFNSHIRELRADLHELKDAMGQMQMVMDTGAVVGAIQKPMDRALGNNMRFTNRRL